MFFIFLMGSIILLNSIVPTVVLGSRGVNKKWFRGLTIVISNLSVSSSFAALNAPKPLPKTTSFFFIFLFNLFYTKIARLNISLYAIKSVF